ncbi:MAG: ribonuclease P [Candidatus Micrarchaeota archaeon]
MNANEIARKRCEKLLLMAREVYSKEPSLAKRYVSLARKISMRHRISLGSQSYCKKCNTIFIPGNTLKVRLERGIRLYICSNCGFTRRFPFKKGKAGKALS